MMKPKCTYKKGDVIKKGDTLGLVVAANYRDVEIHLVNGEKINTVNMNIRHYLKIMKAYNNLNERLITRNITLEQELLDGDPECQDSFINGRIDRLEIQMEEI